MLRIAFLVALGVAATGYLLCSWLALYAQRGEFGLLRALGWDGRSLAGAVALEHGIVVAGGALPGLLAGSVAARLFVPLFQPAFTGAGGPPFLPLGPGPALAAILAVMLALLALGVSLALWLVRRLRISDTAAVEM